MPERRQLDLVVIGGGPAGLAAADAAASHGAQVLLIDQAPRLGGQIWRHRAGDRPTRTARGLLTAVCPPRVSVAVGASVVDALAPDRLVVDFAGRVAVVETQAVVLATGAMERFLAFPGWTLPGVVGVGALQALIKSGTPISGTRIVIAGTGPLIWPVADAATRAGARVALIAEQASAGAVARFGARLLGTPTLAARALVYRRATWRSAFRTSSWPVRAEGRDHLEAVVMQVGRRERRIEVDWLATAAGLVPRTELGRLLGCAMDGEALRVDALQATTVAGVWAAGECTGISGDEGARAEGTIAGLAAIGVATIPGRAQRRRAASRTFGGHLARSFAPRSVLRNRIDPSTIICRCEDVRAGAVEPEWSYRQAKLWTRLGMGACQGRVCGTVCAHAYGWEPNAVRPPLEQPSLGGWAGAITDPDPTAEAPGRSGPPTR